MSLKALLVMVVVLLVCVIAGAAALIVGDQEDCFNPPQCNVTGGP